MTIFEGFGFEEQFNANDDGFLQFEEFVKFMARLSQLANQPSPSFPVTRDLFNYLDVRGDGVIDLTEWMQGFKRIEVIHSRMAPKPNNFSKKKID
jgi:Ca2+-binding EF-hand superfamily protein